MSIVKNVARGMDEIRDKFDEGEAQRRFEAALKSAMNTPHKPLKEKPKVKKAAKKTKVKKR
jgi:hypothetical protein